jgi:mRNA interferase YafQ
MLAIDSTAGFKKDYKRWKKHEDVVKLFQAVTLLLVHQEPLPPALCDHKLVGRLSHLRECHIRPNLLLIYEPMEGAIKFHRLCNHSELFNA